MPYDDNTSLPDPVRDSLNDSAQSVYREAYNAARNEYGETRAHKVAWGAVKNAGYHKVNGKWEKSDK